MRPINALILPTLPIKTHCTLLAAIHAVTIMPHAGIMHFDVHGPQHSIAVLSYIA